MDLITHIAHIKRQRHVTAATIAHLDAELETAVVAAFLAGHTGPEIATAAGLSKQRVYQIRDGTR